MHTYAIFPILAFAVLVSLGGCEPGPLSAHESDPLVTSVVEVSSPLDQEAIILRTLLPTHASFLEGRDPHEVARRDHSAAIRSLGGALEDLRAAGLDDMHQIASQTAERNPLDVRWAVDNIFAQYILDAGLHRGNLSDHPDIIAHHLQVLLETESMRADLIAPSLSVMRGIWDDEKIRQSAETAATHAEGWIRLAEDSASRRESEHGAGAAAIVPAREDIAAAATELRLMVGR